MTHANATERPRSGARSLGTGRKAVLVCPGCRHESPLPGDWVLVIREEGMDVRCPDCRATLTTRPR